MTHRTSNENKRDAAAQRRQNGCAGGEDEGKDHACRDVVLSRVSGALSCVRKDHACRDVVLAFSQLLLDLACCLGRR